ncbi:MAG: SEFIR domain-containing protein [Planctomycetota bacterium]|jgi:tetratricopeptide (TPR) repeat protein
MSKKERREPPVVFISYSQDSQEHMDKVLAFANRLRAEGIDAALDQYEVSPAEGWPKWMDRQIENSDFVLAVCTPIYYRRVMGTEKEGKGLGVRWESTLMYQHLYDAGGKMTGFIPVLFEGGKPEHIPKPLRGANYYRVEQEEGYEDLYRRLTGQPKTKRPKLGKLRELPKLTSLEVREPRSDLLEATSGDSAKKTGVLRKTKQVMLVIDNLEADLFDSAYRRLLCFGLAGFLEIDPSDVRIVRVEAGSVQVTLEIPEEAVEAIVQAVRKGSPGLAEAVKPLCIVRVKAGSDGVTETVERRALPQTESDVKVNVKQLWGVGGFVLVSFVVVIGAITCASRFGGGFWNFMAAVVASFIVLTVLAVIGRFVGVFGEGTVVKFIDAALAALRLGITKGEEEETRVPPQGDSPGDTPRMPQTRQIEPHTSVDDTSPAGVYVEHMDVHYARREDADSSTKAEPEQPPAEKVKALWPEVALPLGGPKVSRPFAGREEELEALRKAMGGEKKVVAVVGMAGQGKSCLAGEWYERGARPPEGIGLFWRKVYEPGFTFDRFLDELHLYLTGEKIERHEIPSVEARAAVVEDALRDKPCWIVLDGVERWLNRWVAEPDAGAEGASVDDRAGQDPVLDKFLKAAHFRQNGSRMLLTTRAVPSALDQNLPMRVGRKAKPDELLAGLKPGDAVTLLNKLGVKGNRTLKREAAQAYGYHPYAVHVLGVLICDLYGKDISRWEQVNPLKEAKLEGLFERIIGHRRQDLELLQLVACSVGPAPVRMLSERLGADEIEIRRKLAELARWQMVEFTQDEAEQHTVVRKFLIERMGQEKATDTQKAIAAWWAEQEVADPLEKLEDVRPRLKAMEHLIAAGEPNAAMDIFLTKITPESNYILNEWLDRFGYMVDSTRLHGELIRAYIKVITKESRRELRNDLASCYNNRGNAFQVQGKLAEAIADYARAIEIYKELVEKESRRELRNDLAMCYNNRGTAFSDQGKLAEAIADYGRAIEIREQLVEKESRRELRNDLASSLFNRAVASTEKKEWENAGADIEKGGALLRGLIEEGQRHVLGSFLKATGFRCTFAKELGDISQAAEWANDAMRWFVEETEAGRMNEVLLKAAAGFAGGIQGNVKVLPKNGLDEELLERFLKALKQAG